MMDEEGPQRSRDYFVEMTDPWGEMLMDNLLLRTGLWLHSLKIQRIFCDL